MKIPTEDARNYPHSEIPLNCPFPTWTGKEVILTYNITTTPEYSEKYNGWTLRVMHDGVEKTILKHPGKKWRFCK